MVKFEAKIDIIGVNPFVFLPESALTEIFKKVGKDKGAIPVRGKIDGHDFIQTLVKFRGDWRLYINGIMLKTTGTKVGDNVMIEIDHDPAERIVAMHPKLEEALKDNAGALAVFNLLSASRKKEIIRYLNSLKSELSVDRNIGKVLKSLTGKARFIGREIPDK